MNAVDAFVLLRDKDDWGFFDADYILDIISTHKISVNHFYPKKFHESLAKVLICTFPAKLVTISGICTVDSPKITYPSRNPY